MVGCAPPGGLRAGVRLRAPEAQAETLEALTNWQAMERERQLLHFPLLSARALRDRGEVEFAHTLAWPQPGGQEGYALPLRAGLSLDLRVETLF